MYQGKLIKINYGHPLLNQLMFVQNILYQVNIKLAINTLLAKLPPPHGYMSLLKKA